MTVYVLAFVPAALRAMAELAVTPYLISSGDVWSAPLSASGLGPATHYGLCAPIEDDGLLAAALPALKAAMPGGDYHMVAVDGYDRGRDWVDWLEGFGLAPVMA